MNRLWRFALSSLTWLLLMWYLATWVDNPGLRYTPGLSDFIFAAFPGIVIVLLCNFFIWFGDGLVSVLRRNLFDSSYADQYRQATHHQATGQGKRKRETLDTVLRDLSDEQLAMLRQRLRDGTIDDELLHERIIHEHEDEDLVHRR